MSVLQPMHGYYLEDLTVGMAAVFGKTVTEADIMAFAGVSGDTNPIHLHADFAKASRFGERIAHGMLVLSYAVGLVPFDPERVVALRRVGDVVFKRPVRLGDTLRVNGKVMETTDVGEDAGLVAFAWSVVNQDDRVVTRAKVEVLWRRDGAAQEFDDAYAVNGFVPIPL